MNIIIREEKKADIAKIYDLVKVAFSTMPYSDGEEQNFVNRLRDSEDYLPKLSLVAELEGEIVGHIMFSKIRIDDYDNALSLAPVSVLPKYQNKGIGSLLIQAGEKLATGLGYDFIIVIGHEHYYPRFGYSPARRWGLEVSFPVSDEVFMVKPLKQGVLGTIRGLVKFSKSYGIE